MPEYQEPEPQRLDLKPFREIPVEELGKSTITRKVPIENLGITAEFKLEEVGFEQIPFISEHKPRPRSWRLTAKIESALPLSETALKRIRILVRIYPEGNTFVSKIGNLSEKVFEGWTETDENGTCLKEAKTQPLLVDDNLIKIQQLEAGGFLQELGRLTHG